MPPPPPLPDELLEEIFVRLPPAEPACLVRASLASKEWLSRLSGPRFRGRYRDHHGALPTLGFLSSTPWDSPKGYGPAAPPFVSTTGFRARVPGDGWGDREYTAWDCRHGRVLLGESESFMLMGYTRWLAVWDPMTGRRLELREPEVANRYGRYAAAVLCAVSGCDHLACHDAPFRVVYFSLHRVAGDDFVAQAFVYSTDLHRAAEWADPCPGISVGHDGYIEPRPPVLLNEAVHFLLGHDQQFGAEILKYDLSSNSLSLIDAPSAGANMAKNSVLMAMEDGTLGFAHLKELTLAIWSRDVGSDGVAAWPQRRVIHLKNILPIRNPRIDVSLTGSVEGSDIVFVTTHRGIYKINLKSLQQKKKNKILNGKYHGSLIPYMSFCSP